MRKLTDTTLIPGTTTVLTTGIQIQNVDAVAGRVSIKFYDRAGNLKKTLTQNIGPEGSLNVLTDSVTGLANGFQGSATISVAAATSGAPVPRVEAMVATSASSPPLYTAEMGIVQPATVINLPLIACNNSGYYTRIHVRNAGSAEATFRIRYVKGEKGKDWTTGDVKMAANASRVLDMNRICTSTLLGTSFVGSAIITSTTAQPLAVSVHFIGTAASSRSLSGYNGFQGGATKVHLPLIMAKNSNYYTSIQVQNIGTASTQVAINYADDPANGWPAGQPSSTNHALDAGVSTTVQQYGGPWTKRYVGGATLTSGQPIVAVVNQARTGSAMAATYEGIDDADTSHRLAVPLVMANNSGYLSSIQVQMAEAITGSEEVVVAYSPYQPSAGAPWWTPAPDVFMLKAGETKTLIQAGGKWAPANIPGGKYIGSATISSEWGKVAAIANANGPASGDTLASYIPAKVPDRQWDAGARLGDGGSLVLGGATIQTSGCDGGSVQVNVATSGGYVAAGTRQIGPAIEVGLGKNYGTCRYCVTLKVKSSESLNDPKLFGFTNHDPVAGTTAAVTVAAGGINPTAKTILACSHDLGIVTPVQFTGVTEVLSTIQSFDGGIPDDARCSEFGIDYRDGGRPDFLQPESPYNVAKMIHHAYLFVGLSESFGANPQWTVGYDEVWDLWNQEFAAFTYSGSSKSSYSLIGGASLGFYAGQGWGRQQGVLEAWTGYAVAFNQTWDPLSPFWWVDSGLFVGGSLFASSNDGKVPVIPPSGTFGYSVSGGGGVSVSWPVADMLANSSTTSAYWTPYNAATEDVKNRLAVELGGDVELPQKTLNNKTYKYVTFGRHKGTYLERAKILARAMTIRNPLLTGISKLGVDNALKIGALRDRLNEPWADPRLQGECYCKQRAGGCGYRAYPYLNKAQYANNTTPPSGLSPIPFHMEVSSDPVPFVQNSSTTLSCLLVNGALHAYGKESLYTYDSGALVSGCAHIHTARHNGIYCCRK